MRRSISALAFVALLLWISISRDISSETIGMIDTSAGKETKQQPLTKKETHKATQPPSKISTSDENSDMSEKEESDRLTACWNKLIEEQKSNCRGSCVARNARVSGSWLSDWIEDGWAEPNSQLNPNQSTLPGKFFYALALGGVLEGRAVENKNPHEAIDRLLELHESDPENSAFLLYASLIANNLGKHDYAKFLIQKAKENGNKYDTFMLTIRKELFRQARNDPLAFIEGTDIYTRLPIADISSLHTMLKKINADNSFLARQMMAPAFEAKGAYSDINWSILDYAIGYALLKHTSEESVSNVPTWKDWMGENFEDQNLAALANDELVRNCRAESIIPWISHIQDVL